MSPLTVVATVTVVTTEWAQRRVSDMCRKHRPPLMVMTVELEGTAPGEIEIRAFDDPRDLAETFITARGLDADMLLSGGETLLTSLTRLIGVSTLAAYVCGGWGMRGWVGGWVGG
jgi:hypothetical protein